MKRTATPIPGSKNHYREIVKIDADFTKEFLQAELAKVIGGQVPSMRSNPRYIRTVRRYREAIMARDPYAPCLNHVETPGRNCPTCGF